MLDLGVAYPNWGPLLSAPATSVKKRVLAKMILYLWNKNNIYFMNTCTVLLIYIFHMISNYVHFIVCQLFNVLHVLNMVGKLNYTK